MPKYEGEPEGYVHNPLELDCSGSLVILVKEIGDYLERTYPGWAWTIQPNERGGVINLRALKLHGVWGYIMKIADLQNDPERKLLRRGAGEILERFGQPRGSFNYERWKAIPRDIAGDCVPDVADKIGKRQKRARTEAINKAVRAGRAKFLTEQRDGQNHVFLRHEQ